MRLKTLGDFNFKGKWVLLRSDLNSDIINGKVIRGARIRESAKTIAKLKKEGAKVVILAHQGNPNKKNFLGMKQHAKLLGNYVKFIEDVVGSRAINAIKKMKDGDVILLDNVRKVEDEFSPNKKNNQLLLRLLPLFDIFINDAFSVSHRNQTSVVGFTRKMSSGIGLLFEKEIRALEKISVKNSLFVLGGAKPESNIKLLGRGNEVLVCGLFGQVCLAATGFDFGYQNKFLEKTVLVEGGYVNFLKRVKRKLKDAETPVDFAIDVNGGRKEFSLSRFPMEYEIEDLGKATIEKYCKQIRKAKSVYMKGPAGFAEDVKFRKGTTALLKAASECKGFSLVGGGQLSEAIAKSGIPKKKFGHVSLSGGALLRFVAGEKLIGLKALGYYKFRNPKT